MTLLAELHRRTGPLGWVYERQDEAFHRFTAPGTQRLIEVDVRSHVTIVEGWAFEEPISLTFGPERPVALVIDALERWGALPTESVVAR